MSRFLKNLSASFYRTVVSSRPIFNSSNAFYSAVCSCGGKFLVPLPRLAINSIGRSHARSIFYGTNTKCLGVARRLYGAKKSGKKKPETKAKVKKSDGAIVCTGKNMEISCDIDCDKVLGKSKAPKKKDESCQPKKEVKKEKSSPKTTQMKKCDKTQKVERKCDDQESDKKKEEISCDKPKKSDKSSEKQSKVDYVNKCRIDPKEFKGKWTSSSCPRFKFKCPGYDCASKGKQEDGKQFVPRELDCVKQEEPEEVCLKEQEVCEEKEPEKEEQEVCQEEIECPEEKPVCPDYCSRKEKPEKPVLPAYCFRKEKPEKPVSPTKEKPEKPCPEPKKEEVCQEKPKPCDNVAEDECEEKICPKAETCGQKEKKVEAEKKKVSPCAKEDPRKQIQALASEKSKEDPCDKSKKEKKKLPPKDCKPCTKRSSADKHPVGQNTALIVTTVQQKDVKKIERVKKEADKKSDKAKSLCSPKQKTKYQQKPKTCEDGGKDYLSSVCKAMLGKKAAKKLKPSESKSAPTVSKKDKKKTECPEAKTMPKSKSQSAVEPKKKPSSAPPKISCGIVEDDLKKPCNFSPAHAEYKCPPKETTSTKKKKCEEKSKTDQKPDQSPLMQCIAQCRENKNRSMKKPGDKAIKAFVPCKNEEIKSPLPRTSTSSCKSASKPRKGRKKKKRARSRSCQKELKEGGEKKKKCASEMFPTKQTNECGKKTKRDDACDNN